MWAFVSELILNIVIAIESDKVVVEAGKKLIAKGVDSVSEGIGITDDDAKHLVEQITRSTLNNFNVVK